MPIKVVCSGCSKSFQAKDSLAGKRVKCPACQNVIDIPATQAPLQTATVQTESQNVATHSSGETRQDLADQALHDSLLQSLDENRFEDAASILKVIHLWMISATDTEEFQPLIAEVEDMDAVVAFTSQEFLQQFVSSSTEFVQPDGSVNAFAVDGPGVFAQLQGDIGILLNPETNNALLLDEECVAEIQTHLNNPRLKPPSVNIELPINHGQKNGPSNPAALALRNRVLERLNKMGFHPAEWMPLADLERELRPATEIADRLMALACVFAWASAPAEAVPGNQLNEFLKRNKLSRWVTESEREILSLPRQRANSEFSGVVGWRTENMWPLAWVLGYDRLPDLGSSQIDPEVIHSMIFEFIGGFDASRNSILEKNRIRSVAEVRELEDFFYCAHNAVRCAQFGKSDTRAVPDGFDPVGHGGAVHERRHSLTWCLSPDTDWDDTDLST